MRVRLAVAALVISILKCASKYNGRGPLNKHGILFTNHKLPSIHSESVPRSRSKASTYRVRRKITSPLGTVICTTRHNSADSVPTTNLVCVKDVAIRTTFSHMINFAGIIFYTCILVIDIQCTRYKNSFNKRF